MVKEIKIEDFDYELPDEAVAKYPLEKRDDCRLIVRTPEGRISHRKFGELPALLPSGTMMVCNDTKVIKARLLFHKESGAAIEIFLLEPLAPADYALSFQSNESCTWKCMVGNLKKWKDGDLHMEILDTETGESVTLHARRKETLPEGGVAVEFYWNNPSETFSSLTERAGRIPIPPYLHRESEESDLTDYQTVYAMAQGSVAAPTAGLHFTPEVFEGLKDHDIPVRKLTLHVGAGTFRPVKSDTIGEHDMHSERFTVTVGLLEDLIEWKRAGKPVAAVGTTTVRTLESLPLIADAIREGRKNPLHVEQWDAYSLKDDFNTVEALEFLAGYMKERGMRELSASTSIMIAPGFRWRITDILVTNFHQPKSTLLLLVSSFLETSGDFDEWRRLYEEALKQGYRFLSYGDACLLFRAGGSKKYGV